MVGSRRREGKRRDTNHRSRKSPEENSDESSDMEEGYLARHHRRMGNTRHLSSTSNDGAGEKTDELEWDNYNHSRLFEPWSEMDQQYDDQRQHELHTETTEEIVVEEKPKPLNRKQEKKRKSRKSAELREKSTNKVPHSGRPCYMDDPVLMSNEEEEDGTSASNTENETSRQQLNQKKKLYDPSNPDTPILVKSNRRGCVKVDKMNENIPVYNQEYFSSPRFPAPNPRNLPLDGRRQRTLYDATTNTNQVYVPPARTSNYFMPSPIPPEAWKSNDKYTYEMEQRKQQQVPSEQEEALIADHMTNIRRQSCVTMLAEAEKHETAISSLLSNSDFTMKNFTEILRKSRNKLKQIYESLILTDIETASKHNVEQTLWKNVFHQVIEKLREQIASCTEDEKTELKDLLILILDQAIAFYENLVSGLQQTYRFSIKEMLRNPTVARSVHKQAGKRTKFAIMSVQRSLICLGDITRYKENANDTNNFGRARNWYMQARALEPRNGRPYNQLAILAVRTRRKLDAVYYYARSLATIGNPILTARESLIALFDDARRKLEYTQRKEGSKNQKTTISDQENKPTKSKGNSPMQIWCKPGSSHPQESSASSKSSPTSKEQTDLTPDLEKLSLSSLTPSEIMKQFSLMFINIHGKLFTRVGFESFHELKQKVLHLFQQALQFRPPLISSQTLQHVMAINYFSVFDQQQKHHNENSSSMMCAVQITFDMVAMITKEVTTCLTSMTFDPELGFVPSSCKELSVILPSFKLCCDWLFSNRDIWYPHPPIVDDRSIYLWNNLAELCDWLCSDDKQFSVRTFMDNHHDLVEVSLAEDFEMSGFSPLVNSESETRFVMNKEAGGSDVEDCVRLNLIRDFLEYLCGMEEPLLAFKQGRYVALVESKPVECIVNDGGYIQDMIEADLQDVDTSFEEEQPDSENEFSELKAYRDSLQRTRDVHEKRRNQIQASLDAAGSKNKKMYVTPKSLIPDTNCFIDHLDMISDLMDHGQFIVCVCLVVLTELEGLAQESKGNTEHNRRVHANAAASLRFIQEKFTSRHGALRALTNQGSALDTISFRSQNHYSDKGTNDDLILMCCEKYEEKTKKNNSCSTVLLTDDRNLRVKSLTRNMPTKSIPEFCKWLSAVEH
ncbi:telomerase-binding protein EST1A isoform X1 [Ciona intestinalis]